MCQRIRKIAIEIKIHPKQLKYINVIGDEFVSCRLVTRKHKSLPLQKFK